jgi:hypothetical protein
MHSVNDLIKELQARLQNSGGGEILINDKTFTIKLTGSLLEWVKNMGGENTTSFVSKTRNL